jgi:hypothetical protein
MARSSGYGARRRLLGLTAVAVAGVVALVVVGFAHAASAQVSVNFVNYWTNYCLDSNYHDPAASNPSQGAVYSLPCNGGNYQNWNPGLGSSGLTIVDQQTGLCLDSNYDGAVYTLPCNGGNYQNWNIYSNSWGYVSIEDAQTGMCLYSDESGNISTTISCTGYYQGTNWL